jgi:hypothetical protein
VCAAYIALVRSHKYTSKWKIMQTRILWRAPIWRILALTVAIVSFTVQIDRAAAQNTAPLIETSLLSEIQLRFPDSTILSISFGSADVPRIVEIATPGTRAVVARVMPLPSARIDYADPRELLVSLKRSQSRRHLDSW